MFASMPPYYLGNSIMEGLLDAVGRELQRVSDRKDAIQLDFQPSTSPDAFGGLQLWELLLGLPVNPPVSITTRRNLVLATLAARGEGSGTAWIDALNKALGGTPWTYQEGPSDYAVSIYVPFSSTSFSSTQVGFLARSITPAHLDLLIQYDQGFIIGEGLIGEDRL